MNTGISFVLPALLPLLWLVPVVWAVLLLLDRARARGIGGALGPRAELLMNARDSSRRRLRRVLFSAALACALLSLGQPSWGDTEREIEQRGIDIVVCLDVSRSMLARDEKPDRLGRARREIRALAERASGDRLALVEFSGSARLAVPLTSDVATYVELVELANPFDVTRGGTNLGAAIEIALEALGGRTGSHEVIVLVSDGEDLDGRGLTAADECRTRGITVHCVGVGSSRGSKIVVAGEGGEVFLRDRAGAEVVTAMDSEGLRSIADATGGAFVDAHDSPRPLLRLYEQEIRSMARQSFDVQRRRERANRYQLPLLLAFLLWLIELGLPDRRRE